MLMPPVSCYMSTAGGAIKRLKPVSPARKNSDDTSCDCAALFRHSRPAHRSFDRPPGITANDADRRCFIEHKAPARDTGTSDRLRPITSSTFRLPAPSDRRQRHRQEHGELGRSRQLVRLHLRDIVRRFRHPTCRDVANRCIFIIFHPPPSLTNHPLHRRQSQITAATGKPRRLMPDRGIPLIAEHAADLSSPRESSRLPSRELRQPGAALAVDVLQTHSTTHCSC